MRWHGAVKSGKGSALTRPAWLWSGSEARRKGKVQR